MNAIFVIIGIGLVISLLTLNAPKISSWCERQLAKKN